ncbi:hypothetical protein IQ07DRAFT_542302 [Pyrenochaeta sp. DS3sAY3a]|nr:hypothetical protein IQ07DRAFT_542302 [Pyrenochaeta sp. DS3sAY3a]
MAFPSAPTTTHAPATARPQQHSIDYYRSTADDDAAVLEHQRMRRMEQKEQTKANKKRAKQYGSWFPEKAHAYPKPASHDDGPRAYRSNLRAFRADGANMHRKTDFMSSLKAATVKPKGAARNQSEDSNGSRPMSSSSSEAPKFTAALSSALPDLPASESGEDAYAHRMRLYQEQQNVPPPPPPPPSDPQGAPPPPPPMSSSTLHGGATMPAAAVFANATISAPPVLYNLPETQPTDDYEEPESYEPPAKRVKVVSKAEAMMAKMGYQKGQGLGKNNDGVVNPIEVRKRKVPNTINDEGGSNKAQQVWDLSGAQRAQPNEPGKFGQESTVVVAFGCTAQVDWAADANRDDGGVRQEMGEAFSTKFGPVEQIRLDSSNPNSVVYIHFNSILSALNAVNRFDEGWEFRGRKIQAKYYNEQKFHAGIFEY